LDYSINLNIGDIYIVDEDDIRRAAWHALSVVEAQTPLALTVAVTSSEKVRDLNRDFAGKDETTDVLSFPAEEQAYETEDGEPPYIGDIVIAYPVAERQAAERSHTVIAELQTLAIHGVLHLLGYDHQTPEQQAEMWAYESAAMNALREANT